MTTPATNVLNSPEPAQTCASVTPSDTTDLASITRALYVGVTGDVNIDTPDGTTVSFVGVQGVLPVRVRRVRSTGTTATSIVALY